MHVSLVFQGKDELVTELIMFEFVSWAAVSGRFGYQASRLMSAGVDSRWVGWLFAVVFLLLGILLTVQISQWMVRRSPRTRSFQRVAEAAGDAVFEMDLLSRRIEYRNPRELNLGDAEAGDDLQIGIDFSRVHPDDREELRSSWDRLAQGEQLDLQMRLQEAGGGWTWFHLSAVPGPVRGLRNARAYGVIRHTHNLHQRQESLAEARRLETVGTIAGGIAHEFNNHLTPVRGYLELALDDLPPNTPTTDGLRTALERVIHCSELVSQIQAYGRKSLMILQPMDLADHLLSVRSIVQDLDPRHHSRNIRLEEDWPDSLPEVELDLAQFRKALQHLIRNALEAMPQGGVLRVQAQDLEVKEAECYANLDATPGRRVMVRIADTGVGIRDELLNQVMDPFFTTHGRASARGMGLPMVQGMMAQLGGWMDILSSEGSGTVINLFFPVSVESLPSGSIQPSSDVPALATIPGMEAGRMLVADDERFIRDVVRKVFMSENWIVEEATDFLDVANRFAAIDQPGLDVVLMDLIMPGPTAEDTIRSIRVANPEIRVLVMSGFSRDSRVEAMTRNDGVGFIAKPFSTRDLLKKVEAMMSRTTATATR